MNLVKYSQDARYNYSMFHTDSRIGRCALTFVAIAKPGISKRCEVCNSQFLNEHAVIPVKIRDATEESIDTEQFAPEGSLNGNRTTLHQKFGKHEARPAMTMTQWLLRQYPRCPYCKGNFIG